MPNSFGYNEDSSLSSYKNNATEDSMEEEKYQIVVDEFGNEM